MAAGETPSLIREFIGETHRAQEYTQNPYRTQHQKGPIYLWVVQEVTESQWRAKQAALLPPRPLPHIQPQNAAMCVALPWRIPKVQPLTM